MRWGHILRLSLIHIFEQYPQVMINVLVKNELKEKVLSDHEVQLAMREVTEKLGDEGRILVRPSGTEPLIRVMVEGRASDQVNAIAGHVADIIETVAREG